MHYVRGKTKVKSDYVPGDDFLIADPKGVFHQCFKFMLTGSLVLSTNCEMLYASFYKG